MQTILQEIDIRFRQDDQLNLIDETCRNALYILADSRKLLMTQEMAQGVRDTIDSLNTVMEEYNAKTAN